MSTSSLARAIAFSGVQEFSERSPKISAYSTDLFQELASKMVSPNETLAT